MRRRAFLQSTVSTLATSARGRIHAHQPGMPSTHTYKTAAGCEIKADVYGVDDSAGKPALLWIHGGALIMGSRKSLSPHTRSSSIGPARSRRRISGSSCMRRWRSSWPSQSTKLPASDSKTPAMIAQSMQAGANLFLGKPFSPGELVKTVNDLLEAA